MKPTSPSAATDSRRARSEAHVDEQGPKRALLYLRVSTKEQAMRAGDAEGYSLPTQREACLRTAERLGADVVDEYLDKDTGTMVDKRPAMRDLLTRLSEAQDIDYVIVHKLDRLARNRFDDAQMTLTIEAAGATLVSCVEGIDQSPSGRLLQGMLASVNEYYSRNLSDEIKRKTLSKVKGGGTPHLAPIGYLNKRELSGGRDERWVELDPERAPLIAWAFEAYATGDWSLSSLQAELTARGLTTRPTTKRPAKELHESLLQRVLVRPYYMGTVTFRGVEYEGSHPAIVSPEVFFKVQDVLKAHNTAGERSWKHEHYLKGTLFCADCSSRLCLDFATGNGGRYAYFVCLGRKRKVVCAQKALQADFVEEAIERHWRSVRIGEGRKTEIRGVLTTDLELERQDAEADRRIQERQVQKLKDERQKLLDAYFATAIPLELLKSEQDRISRALAQAEQRLDSVTIAFDRVEQTITSAVAWADQLHMAYQAAAEPVRRLLNQAVFKRIYLGPDGVIGVEYTDGFDWLLGDDVADGSVVESEPGGADEAAVLGHLGTNARDAGRMARASSQGSRRHGWNVERLVEVSGFEPPTSTLRTWRSAS